MEIKSSKRQAKSISFSTVYSSVFRSNSSGRSRSSSSSSSKSSSSSCCTNSITSGKPATTTSTSNGNANGCTIGSANGSASANISYTLYLYREELRRRNARFLRLSHTKFRLTDKLISKNVRNLHACSVEDLQHINRGLMFRKELKQQIVRLHRLNELGLANVNPNAMSTDL